MTAERTDTVVVDPGTVRLALTVGGLLLALLAGFGLGRVGTAPRQPAPVSAGATSAGHTDPPGAAPHSHPGTAPTGQAPGVGGLSMTADGLTMRPESTTFRPGVRRDLRFRIVGADGEPVTRFQIVHDKPMHLIVVRRDLSGYQHLHPTMGADGTWSVPLTLGAPGIWRAYADFTADRDGASVASTLGVDLVVPGAYAPRPLPPAARTATTGGHTVAWQGTPQVGATTPVLFRVYADGAPVTALERYLGAYGHLVALRDGDLAYLHVHPEPQLDGGAVTFRLSAPGPGRYRFFFEFQVAGVVRAAEFTVDVP